MKKRLIATAAVALGLTAAVAPTAQADGHTLADYVIAENTGFDTNQDDFDIVTSAILATDEAGNFLFPDIVEAAATAPALTVFLPTDKSFRILVEDLGLGSIKDEQALFEAIVATVGPEAVGNILRYHIIPSLRADSTAVTGLENGTPLVTFLDKEVVVEFKGKKQIRIVDDGGPGRDPIVRTVDIDAGNAVVHVIDRVLIPAADSSDS